MTKIGGKGGVFISRGLGYESNLIRRELVVWVGWGDDGHALWIVVHGGRVHLDLVECGGFLSLAGQRAHKKVGERNKGPGGLHLSSP